MAQEVGVKSIPELKQFGKDLKVLSDQLQITFQAAEKKMHHVCEGWNDNVNTRFMELFQNDAKNISQIANRMREFSQFISKSCEILEMYQNSRL